MPIDLTVLLLLILIPAVALGIWKKSHDVSSLGILLLCPYCCHDASEPDLTLRILSLGLDKTARFLVIDGLCIISPFVILTSPARINRFFITLLVAGLAASAISLTSLGGYDRLTTPSGDTIRLGHDAALGIVIVWFGLLPRKKLSAPGYSYTR